MRYFTRATQEQSSVWRIVPQVLFYNLAGGYEKVIRQHRGQLVVLCLLMIFIFCGPAVYAQSQQGMDLVTGIGYPSIGSGPVVLMGAELKQRTRDFGIGLRIANELGTSGGDNTISLQASGDWSHARLPFYALNLGVSAHLSQRANETASTVAIRGDGSYGNLRGNLVVGYTGGRLSSFPWHPDELSEMGANGEPYYYFQTNVTASILPTQGLRWSQDVAWQRSLVDNHTAMTIVTGPNVRLGSGRLSLQSGMVIGPSGMVPRTRLSYSLDSFNGPDAMGQIEFSIDTTSLQGGGPVLQGAYTLQADWWKVQAMVRVETDDLAHPKLYFSILPLF